MVFIRSISRQLRRPATQFLAANGPLKPAVTPNPFARVSPLSGAFSNARTLTATANRQGKVLLVLYDVSQSAPKSKSDWDNC